MSRILFSPVGGTDPISMNNYHDGSMLHIIRYYSPEIILLYMSEEIFQFHCSDNRYIYCIEHLCSQKGFSVRTDLLDKNQLDQLQTHLNKTEPGVCHCIIIKDAELQNVHEYNIFIDEFSREISILKKCMTKSDELLLNVSSGTPAMKSALLVLSTMLDYQCRMIQVTTPEGAMNEHSHKDYDVEFLWEADEDNDKDQNRCHEVNFKSLAMIKYKNILRQLISNYDYAGSLDVCKSVKMIDPTFDDRPVRMAEKRNLLNIIEARKIARELNIDLCPIKADEDMKLFEYATNLFVKAKKKEYADFIRGLTPLILPLCIRILKEQTPDHIDIHHYIRRGKREKCMKWDQQLLQGSDEGIRLDEVLNHSFNNHFSYDVVYSVHIVKLIEEFCQKQEIIDLMDSLRKVESNIRNIVAHQMVSVSQQTIIHVTGHTTDDCIAMIKKAFQYARINVRREYWNTYENMNMEIIQRL